MKRVLKKAKMRVYNIRGIRQEGEPVSTLEDRFFGRASAQLGNLGHPTSLAEYSEDNPRGGERPGEPQGVD